MNIYFEKDVVAMGNYFVDVDLEDKIREILNKAYDNAIKLINSKYPDNDRIKGYLLRNITIPTDQILNNLIHNKAYRDKLYIKVVNIDGRNVITYKDTFILNVKDKERERFVKPIDRVSVVR